MADDVSVSIGAKIDGVLAAIDQVKQQVGSMGSVAQKVNDQFTGLAKTLAGALGLGLTIGAMDSFVRKMADAGLHSEALKAQLGATGEGLGELKAIAKLTGVDIDGMALGIERLALNVQHATKDAFSPQNQALKTLGLSTKDLIGLPADQYFNKLAESVSKFNPSMNLTNALMQLGGRSVVQMLPALLQGRDFLEQWGQKIKDVRFGLEGFSQRAADTHARLVVMDSALDAAAKRIFLALKPAIDVIIGALTNFFASLDAKTVRDFAMTLTEVLAKAAITLIGVFYSLGGTIDDLLSKMKNLMLGVGIGGAVGLLGGPATAAFGAILGGGIGAAWKDFMAFFDKGEKTAEKTVDEGKDAMVARVTAMADAIKKALGSAFGSVAGGGGGKSDAGAMDMAARTNIEATVARIQGEIALLRGALAQKQVIYQRDADLWGITEQQKLRLTRDATAAEFAAEEQKLTKIRDLWPAHTKEWEEANRKMIQSTQTFATEMLRINADMARDMKAKFDEVSNAFQSSFNGQLRGLLAGTTTWRQAFKSIMGDMVIFAIQAVEKMVANWITGKLAMLATDTSTAATSAATQIAAQEATLPIRAAAFLSDLAARAALTFAGVFANLSPIMGPAAAGPAGVAEAAVMAQAAAVPKLAVGTDMVMRSGLAFLHEGEKVTPAETSGPFTGASGPGGNGGGLTIQAWDGASVQRWLARGGADMLARALKGTGGLNPSLRPA